MMVSAVLLLAVAFARPEALVSTEWLAANLDTPGLRVVDLRRDGYEGYATGHVPGAVNLENAAIRDPGNPPTFLPSQEAFEATMGALGIGNDTRVIVYDDRGGLYAARLWWILSYFGHQNVALLDGGWIKWSREGRPVSTEIPPARSATFRATPRPEWLATAEDVREAMGRPGARLVDARTPAEIEGKDLRGIKRGGFIPSAIPVYWEDQLDPETRALKPPEALAELYRSRGVLPSDAVIAYCQVGMRASHDLFVLYLLGYPSLRNYYGAWEEWGNREELPIATSSKPR
jgi:thiosulfate/3-mercaptopyruvate sulfurtransferase